MGMKKTLVFCGYRKWALDIYKELKSDDYNIVLIKDYQGSEDLIAQINPIAVFFVGWSWMVSDKTINGRPCICLHPSPLPKYRGGSPIQWQIINGEKESAVTLFRMTDRMDAGDILFQKFFNLDGTLEEVLTSIYEQGVYGIQSLIDTGHFYTGKPQDDSDATTFKRRTPEQSEITEECLRSLHPESIHNKVRSLQGDYPTAYIKCKDGKKLFLKETDYEK